MLTRARCPMENHRLPPGETPEMGVGTWPGQEGDTVPQKALFQTILASVDATVSTNS